MTNLNSNSLTPAYPATHPLGKATPGWVVVDDPDKVPRCLRPLKVRGTVLPNRIWLSPMCMYSADGSATPNHFHMVEYGRAAVQGMGLVMVEATAVKPEGRISSRDLGLYESAHTASFKNIVALSHGFGTPIGIQLAHAGRKASSYPTTGAISPVRGTLPADLDGWPDEVVGPSPIPYGANYVTPQELTRAQIKEIVDAFGSAAARAEEAKFDVVQIHGAHGYLIHAFLSPYSNKRTDEYGGSFENRTRILIEIARAVRENWPATKPLFLRLSCSDNLSDANEPSWDLEQCVKLAKLLVDENVGVDLIDCTTGGLASAQVWPKDLSFHRELAAKLKEQVPGMLVSVVGGITSAADVELDALQQRNLDAVHVGRQFLRTPSFAVDVASSLYDQAIKSNPDAPVGWNLMPPYQFRAAFQRPSLAKR